MVERRLTATVNYEGDIFVSADGNLLWCVFGNLLGNICKYAKAGSPVVISAQAQADRAVFRFENEAEFPDDFEPERLIGRFLRATVSGSREGYGLGLAIADSLVRLQNGTLDIQVTDNRFIAEITLLIDG